MMSFLLLMIQTEKILLELSYMNNTSIFEGFFIYLCFWNKYCNFSLLGKYFVYLFLVILLPAKTNMFGHWFM